MTLEAMRNLGKKSAARLRAVGIITEEDLRNIGAVDAFRRLKSHFPEVSFVFLLALFGALNDFDFREIPPEIKEKLRVEMGQGTPPPLESMKNIGRKMAENLNEVGIFSRDDLEQVGVEETFVRMRKKDPSKDLCACVLYALYGALHDQKWNEISEEKKRVFRDFSHEVAKKIPRKI